MESDLLPFARLATLGLPPRVRSLLEGSFHAAEPHVEAGLARAMDELDRDLLAHAERDSSAHEQSQCLSSLREFRQRRNDFLIACRNAMQRSLLALVDPTVVDESLEAISAKTTGPDAADMDVAHRDAVPVLAQIASRAEIRAAAGLQAMAYRFGVIAGSAPLELDTLPLGPSKLCAAIHSAARRFQVFPLHRIALYRRIDKCLFAEPTALYDAINNYLIAHRVYAHLQLVPRSPTAAPGVAEAAPLAPPSTPPGRTPDQPVRADGVPPTAAPPPSSQPRPAVDGSARMHAAEPVPTAAAPDAQFFRTLLERIASRRKQPAASELTSAGAGALVDRGELQSALRVLQSQALAPVMVGGMWVNRSVAHIKMDLMNQLRSSGGGAPRRLRDDDADTIELVALLFARLLEAYRPNSMSHVVISRLQIPVLRVALGDPSFFTSRTQPARRLISSMVEALAEWVEDEDSDRPLVEQLQQLADRLAREYQDDLAAFDRCREDVGRQIGSLQKKAEIAERRHVEAAKGRVKLDLARAAAFEVVRQRVADSRAPAGVVALLDSAWTDAIALSLLRQGVDHPKSAERIELVDQLLAIYADSRPPAQRHRALEALRGPLEEGLAAVGFHDNAVVAAWTDLSNLIDATHEQAQQAAAHAISELIRQKPRLGGDSHGAPASAVAADDPRQSSENETVALSREELDVVERLKQAQIGSWFEFTQNRQGDKARRRLCWFSPVTGRYLFLNVRGGKSEDRMLAQLAREIVRGTVRQIPAGAADPVDRAWHAIMAAALTATGMSRP